MCADQEVRPSHSPAFLQAPRANKQLLVQLIAHDALSALINLSSSTEVATRLSKIDGFLTGLVRMIIASRHRLRCIRLGANLVPTRLTPAVWLHRTRRRSSPIWR